MKRFLIILAGISFLSCGNAQNDKEQNKTDSESITKQIQHKDNDLNFLNLKGKVKFIREIPYTAMEISGKIEKGEIERGVDFTTNYFYNLIHGDITTPFTREFNEKGNETLRYTVEQQLHFEHDDKGNVIQQDYTGKEVGTSVYKYNENGNIVEFQYNGKETPQNKKIIFKYEKDKLTEIEVYNEAKLIEKQNLVHNDKGFKIITQDITGYFNNKGNVLEINSSTPIKVKYNDNGDVDTTMMADSVLKFKYTYDEKGNWINRITYSDDKPIIITERVIEYYP
ncbi:MAG: hypothetical protein Q4A00_06700 [Flavobacteriaceae bacterium]|nr:hypothetical protein [Flavobacteriaceae bacterium]